MVMDILELCAEDRSSPDEEEVISVQGSWLGKSLKQWVLSELGFEG